MTREAERGGATQVLLFVDKSAMRALYRGRTASKGPVIRRHRRHTTKEEARLDFSQVLCGVTSTRSRSTLQYTDKITICRALHCSTTSDNQDVADVLCTSSHSQSTSNPEGAKVLCTCVK